MRNSKTTWVIVGAFLVILLLVILNRSVQDIGVGADKTPQDLIFDDISAKQEQQSGEYVQVLKGGIYPNDVSGRIANIPDNVAINVRHGGKDGDGYQIILYEKNSTISKGYGSLASETWEIKASSTP